MQSFAQYGNQYLVEDVTRGLVAFSVVLSG